MIEIYHLFFKEKLLLESFHLGGTSVGGWIAQHYTMKYPEEVKSLIIGNSFVNNKILRDQSLGIYKISRFIPWFAFRRVFEKNVRKSLQGYKADVTEYFVQSLHSMTKRELRRKLWWSLAVQPPLILNSSIPKLIIYTKDDAVVSQENTELLIAHYPQASVKVMEIGNHYPYRTNPDEYSTILADFLTRNHSTS